MSQIEIKVNGATVQGNTSEVLLTQLEKAGLTPEFQCRDGMCGTCRCKLKQGQITQAGLPLAATRGDEILACCSVPKGNVVVEFSYSIEPADQPITSARTTNHLENSYSV